MIPTIGKRANYIRFRLFKSFPSLYKVKKADLWLIYFVKAKVI